MNVDDFRKMYVAELQELRSVEDQLVEALPRMAALVEHPQLRQALEFSSFRDEIAAGSPRSPAAGTQCRQSRARRRLDACHHSRGGAMGKNGFRSGLP